MPRTYCKMESDDDEEEEMDQGDSGGESEGGGAGDSSDHESVAGSGSDDDASSEMDEAESERRRTDCIDNMADLENQFAQLKEQLYREKITLVSQKLDEVRLGTAKEYLVPLQKLQDTLRARLQIAEIRLELRKKNIENEKEAELQATRQNFESDKDLLASSIEEDLNDKIRRLEEDRHNIDITSDLFNESQSVRRKRSCVAVTSGSGTMTFGTERRRKPVTVQGPYIVLRLKEAALIEDWSAIKLAIKQAEKLSTTWSEDVSSQQSGSGLHQQMCQPPYRVFCKDGKLHYNKDIFLRGQKILVSHADELPQAAEIRNISHSEITILERDKNITSKLSLHQLRAGKYSIRRAAL